MPTILPVAQSIPNQRVATSFGDDPVILDLRWNSRASAWFMDVRDQNEAPIILGVKLVLGVALGRTSLHPVFMNGVLVLRDLSRSGREATLDDLGTRVELWYFTREEMIAEVLGE